MNDDAIRVAFEALPDRVRAKGPASDARIPVLAGFLVGVRLGVRGVSVPAIHEADADMEAAVRQGWRVGKELGMTNGDAGLRADLQAMLGALPEHIRARAPAPTAPVEHLQAFLAGVRLGAPGLPAPARVAPPAPGGGPPTIREADLERMTFAERQAVREEVERALREGRFQKKDGTWAAPKR